MIRTFTALVGLAFAIALPQPAEACLTRLLQGPAAVEAYLKEKPAQANAALAQLAESFGRDKAYYDATMLELCTLRGGVNLGAQEAMALADRQIMDALIDKWQKIGAAAPATPQPKACGTADDCKNYCKGAGKGKECLPDGTPFCDQAKCSCGLTCR